MVDDGDGCQLPIVLTVVVHDIGDGTGNNGGVVVMLVCGGM